MFLESALRQGVWPLWNPGSDGGVPFAAPSAALYPPDLLLTWLLGARGVLRFGPPLHVFLAMLGAFSLGKTLRLSSWGAWAAGALYGASGFVLSGVNLLPLVQASAWAPFLVAAGLRVAERPSARRTACLAVLLALATSTLCGEIVLQATFLTLVLLPRWPTRRALAGGARRRRAGPARDRALAAAALGRLARQRAKPRFRAERTRSPTRRPPECCSRPRCPRSSATFTP